MYVNTTIFQGIQKAHAELSQRSPIFLYVLIFFFRSTLFITFLH